MPKSPNMVIRPSPSKNRFFWNVCHHEIGLANRVPTSPQPLSGDNCKLRYDQKCVLCLNCPNMVIRSQSSEKLKFVECFAIARKISPVCFQRALNHYQLIMSSQDILKNVFWAPNAQIWQFGPRPQNYGFFLFFVITRKVSAVRF